MSSLLGIALDIIDIDIRMLNAAFEQRRVAIVRAQGQSNFQLRHGMTKYRTALGSSTAGVNRPISRAAANYNPRKSAHCKTNRPKFSDELRPIGVGCEQLSRAKV